jgi:ATP-binding cassette subfamily B protein
MVATSIAELFSIGLVIPFLSALTNPFSITDSFLGKFGLDLFGVTTNYQRTLIITLLFGFAALLSNILRLLLLWSITKFTQSIGAFVSSNIYRRTLYQPFEIQVNLNSSKVIDGVLNKTDSVVILIHSLLVILSSGIILLTFLIAILIIQPVVAITTIFLLSSIFLD